MIEYDDPEAKAARARYSEQLRFDTDSSLDMALDLVFGINGDDDDASAGFTLVVHGKLISGIAVTRNRWAEAQIAQIEPASSVMADHLRTVAETQKRLEAEHRDNTSKEERIGYHREYIHFEKALVEFGNTWFELSALRVCLRDVSAWSFGNVTPTS
ncbi:hypothetical protein [Arthrobacter silvisoli]|uniref:hypothetical protein n=1 Tax=Arthrobacter silvisoli TaxID=2291022 RepID=UPI000E2103EB|nr:hypothetical protein [Arthrobacter silvisoli]